MTEETRQIAEGVAARLEPRLQRIEDDLNVIKPYFELKPGMEPLPTRVANLERVSVGHAAELLDLREQRQKGWLEQLKGNYGLAIAIVAAIGAVLAAIFKP
jgi:hypothetical protein